MFTHVVVGSNDLNVSKLFYDALFQILGVGEGVSDDTSSCRRFVYRGASGSFYVTQPLDGKPASPANGGTVGFAFDSTEQIDRWHATGLRYGGKTAEDPPGIRQGKTGPVYLAYLRDPDGNKLCAVHRISA